MYSVRPFGKATALAAAMFLLSAEAPAWSEDLVPHHATYVLNLAPDGGSSQVTGAEGLLVYDLKKTCDGWATDIKLKFVMSLEGGEARDMEVSQVTWEASDGSSFRYSIKNGSGGQTSQLRGEAKIDAAAGGKATAIADLPAREEAPLPDGVLFPMMHTREVLKQAAAGESVFSAPFFDGSASTEAMQASAVIGPGEKDWSGLPKAFPDLAGKVSYPIGLAFYLGDSNDATPDSEQVLRLYENGVLGAMSFPLFGTLKVRAVLDTLEVRAPEGGC